MSFTAAGPELQPAAQAANGIGDLVPLSTGLRRRRRRLFWYLGGAVVLCISALAAGIFIGSKLGDEDEDDPDGPVLKSKVITVQTIFPARKNLLRYLEQPGTIIPCAQVEVYSKASGYLRRIQRDFSGPVAAEIMAHHAAMMTRGPAGSPLAGPAGFALNSLDSLGRGPEKDIGSVIRQGEVLLEIEAPERWQEVAQKHSLWLQSIAESQQAGSEVETAAQAVEAAKASSFSWEAEVDKARSEEKLQKQKLARLEPLAKAGTVAAELVDETINQVNASSAAVKSAQAKLRSAQAEEKVFSSKLETARADLHVKEARVRVALDAYRRAQIDAAYTQIRAPFDGFIIRRAIDEGDLVENSSAGQHQPLMVLACLRKVKLVVQVPEKDAASVRVGAPAIIRGTSFEVSARVSRTSGALDDATRTMQVEIDLDNRDRRFVPNHAPNVKLLLHKVDNACVVPVSAVYSRAGKDYIFLVSKNVAREQPVRVRYDDGREMEVVKLVGNREVPLDGSEELIVNSRRLLRDGQRVKTSPQGSR